MKKFVFLVLIFSLKGETISPSLFSWFSALKLSQAGGGNLIIAPSSRSGNAANGALRRSFSTSFVLYPADIQAQSVSLLIPKSNRLITVAINHISYGTFKGFDKNAIPTNNYNSSDTWIRIGFSDLLKDIPIRYGISNQLLFSKLEDYSLIKYYCSLGAIWEIKKYKADIGLSIDDILINIDSHNSIENKSQLKYNIGFSKQLAYLPLKISIDHLSINNSDYKDFFISGIFSFSKNLCLSWGTSTRKYSQDTKESVIKTIFGSSGIGIIYKNNELIVGYGVYFYGTGGWTNGLDLSINF
tara:strand:+ start:2753 stop:3649 length:897 start_codon:yes stop_codon:yes gene_type:complete